MKKKIFYSVLLMCLVSCGKAPVESSSEQIPNSEKESVVDSDVSSVESSTEIIESSEVQESSEIQESSSIEESSSEYVFVEPEFSIIDLDEPYDENSNFDDSTKYDYTDYELAGRMFNKDGNVYTSTGSNALFVNTTTPFPYGTISADVKSTNSVDTGFILGYSNTTSDLWEGQGISYYFVFLGQGGVAYIGKTDNGNWEALATKNLGYTIDSNKTYNLKVVYKSNVILLFVNGELEVSYRDVKPLTGVYAGIRTGTSGCSFTNLTLTNEYVYGED